MYSPRLFFKDPLVAGPAIFCLGFQIVIWWFMSTALHPSGEQFFLHYNSVFGVDLVGAWWRLFFIPILGLLIFCVNYGLALLLFRHDRFLARTLSILAALCHAGLFIAAYLLVGINS